MLDFLLKTILFLKAKSNARRLRKCRQVDSGVIEYLRKQEDAGEEFNKRRIEEMRGKCLELEKEAKDATVRFPKSAEYHSSRECGCMILDERTKDALQADKSDIEEWKRRTALYNLDVGDKEDHYISPILAQQRVNFLLSKLGKFTS